MSEIDMSNKLNRSDYNISVEKEQKYRSNPFINFFGFTKNNLKKSDRQKNKQESYKINQEVERVNKKLSMSLLTEMAVIKFMISGEPPAVKRKLRDNLEDLWITYGQMINKNRFTLWRKHSSNNEFRMRYPEIW